jgi:hypothetical protein
MSSLRIINRMALDYGQQPRLYCQELLLFVAQFATYIQQSGTHLIWCAEKKIGKMCRM